MTRRKNADPRRARRRPATTRRVAPALTRWVCPPALTLREVAAAHRALRKLLTARAPVSIDCSRLDCIDTAGAQLLAAFVRERREAGGEARLEAAREPLLAAARLLGLTELEPA